MWDQWFKTHNVTMRVLNKIQCPKTNSKSEQGVRKMRGKGREPIWRNC